MAKEKSIVEDAILQMKNLEEAVAENAKGILASTMKEEIKELVKESLTEAEEDDEEEVDAEVETDEPEEPETEDSEESDGMGMMMGSDDETDNEDEEVDSTDTIDLTKQSDEQVLRVFELMSDDDKIVVKKDDAGNINLKDNESNKEYMIVQESEEDSFGMYDSSEEDFSDEFGSNEFGSEGGSESIEDIVAEVFGEDGEELYGDADMPLDEDDNQFYEQEGEDDNQFYEQEGEGDEFYEQEGEGDEFYEQEGEEEEEENIYEISLEDDMGGMDGGMSDSDFSEFGEGMMSDVQEDDSKTLYEISFDDEEEDEEEFYSDNEEDEFMFESKKMKKSIKPKGVGIGRGPKLNIYGKNPNTSGGFKTIKKKADKTMGTGSAKKGFTYDKKAENLDGEFKIKPKKVEAKEASRTYGSGSKFRKGGLPKPRAHSAFNTAIKENRETQELNILREKNEEYRKALNIFRNKLNEVAVFNSNLAYATRLFTEHSTSKQEKINILRRFDGVETIKESKNLYKTIKDELSGTGNQPMNESIERVMEKAPSTGSAVNLIESKTYENPQFLRMKDLMSKLR